MALLETIFTFLFCLFPIKPSSKSEMLNILADEDYRRVELTPHIELRPIQGENSLTPYLRDYTFSIIVTAKKRGKRNVVWRQKCCTFLEGEIDLSKEKDRTRCCSCINSSMERTEKGLKKRAPYLTVSYFDLKPEDIA
ncbi:MAG: hypothetical protein UT48_C0027G0008 [Parcubacteria group bacterium GW2011_GWE2_39_37]|nr:MAG: hypothetical protein UT48_C0027G0008 [Parcubacteria group bacterium GW2011_GWE2_39_37]